jgi:tetratricopeptide (TPR) repeat protein
VIDALLQAERLLLHGMLDQAEDLYRRTAEQDPRNAIAVVGLARVSLERGDEAGALAHARAALAIDPENSTAIRLELRLTEVLAARAADGRPTDPPAVPPAWSSTAPPEPPRPSEPPAQSEPPAPSERAVFERNRSMAEHRAAEQEPTAPAEQPTQASGQAIDVPRRGLLERLLGRNRRS